MVHRIQNRNPGYSDFSNTNMVDTFNLQNSANSPISDGATALKLEDEVQVNNEVGLSENLYSENINSTETQEIIKDAQEENLKNETNDNQQNDIIETQPSNGLENFGLQEEGSFELFDNKSNEADTLVEEKRKPKRMN